jgi:hypothetical protein
MPAARPTWAMSRGKVILDVNPPWLDKE